MTTAVMAPDERALRAHLDEGRFLSGAAGGQWRLISVDWPIVFVAVAAAARPTGPNEFVLHFEVDGYPNIAPTGGLWDLATGTSLAADQRPKGQRAAELFRTDGWLGGATAMYAPWDRLGLQAHADWAQAHQHDAWTPHRDLSFILAKVHEVINADDYLGV